VGSKTEEMLQIYERRHNQMKWKNINLQLINGCSDSVHGDSALFFKERPVWKRKLVQIN